MSYAVPNIEAVRACTADVLSRFQDIPLTRYEAGFQSSFEEFGNVVHPAGYDRHRSRSEIIAGLRKPPAQTSKAHLQSIEAVRQYVDEHFAATKKDPLIIGFYTAMKIPMAVVELGRSYGPYGSPGLSASIKYPCFGKAREMIPGFLLKSIREPTRAPNDRFPVRAGVPP
jgi:hypothetical protein